MSNKKYEETFLFTESGGEEFWFSKDMLLELGFDVGDKIKLTLTAIVEEKPCPKTSTQQ